MLVITADDYGKNRYATDSILLCHNKGRVTSASAMVFMADSERAASFGFCGGLEIGLHINFTIPFTASSTPSKLQKQHKRLASYLNKHRLYQAIYNPLLADTFNYIFSSQKEEFQRLYSKLPDFYNGHHHMHLCANMLISRQLPKGAKVRGTFTFERGEKGAFNRLYRRILNFHISKRFVSTNSFFSIEPVQDYLRIERIVKRAVKEDVEIEVHPENDKEKDFILADQFRALLESVPIGSYRSLPA